MSSSTCYSLSNRGDTLLVVPVQLVTEEGVKKDEVFVYPGGRALLHEGYRAEPRFLATHVVLKEHAPEVAEE